MQTPRESVWEVVRGVAVLIVLAFFLFALRDLLNPFLLFLLLVGVAFPFRDLPGHRLVVAGATAVTLFWVLHETGFVLAPFILALVLAYIVDPLVDRLEARGVNRSLAIVVLALPVAGALTLLLVVGLPALGDQIADFISQLPVLRDRVSGWLEALERSVAGMDFVPDDLVARIQDIDMDTLIVFLEERKEALARRAWEGVLGLGRGIGSALTVLGYVVLTPVLTFYLLRDWDVLTGRVADLVPRGRRELVVGFFREYDRLLSAYLRGQMTVALVVGSITALGLWILQFPYAFLVGTAVGVFGLVPYLGLLLSLVPAVIIALVTGNPLASLLKVAVVFGVAQGLEGAVISPRIVGDSVGLHPVWVVLALAVGGYFFGFVGLLLGVPLAVGVKLLAERGVTHYRSTALYREGGSPAASDV